MPVETLSFLIHGLPRSGTTALAQALNLQPGLFCAHEHGFALRTGLTREAMQQAVLEQDGRSPPGTMRRRSHDELQAKLAAGTLTKMGDKLPEYFLSLPAIDALHPGARHICIWRDPFGATRSWDMRTEVPNDAAWPPGRIGLFGLLDLLLLAGILARRQGDTLLVSHAALFRGDPALYAGLVREMTGQDPAPETEAAFAQGFFARRPPDARQARASPYRALIAAMGAMALDQQIQQVGLLRGPALSAQFETFLPGALPGLEDQAMAHLDALPEPKRTAALAYGRDWVRARLDQAARLGPDLPMEVPALFARLADRLG